MSHTLRATLLTLLTALLLVPATTVAEGKKKAPRAAAAQECADADLEATSENLGRIREAILCLHNQIRAEHDLPALRENKRLRKAALGHSKDMVRHRYFAHESRSGAPFTARIARTGWTHSRHRYVLGENIGWGTGDLATPRAMVRGWMHSAPHRANILERRYRALGIGVAFGVPVGGTGATYSTDFGG
jgi:uncharacterized protein YkwD